MGEQYTGKTKGRGAVILSAWILANGFLVNLVWENAQAFLYVGYRGFIEHFWICFVASVIDALVILLVYLVLSLLYMDIYWPRHNTFVRYAVVAFISGALAIGFELWALANGEWEYTELMPVVPGLNVGLSPLIQLVVLPILTYYASVQGLNRFTLFRSKQTKRAE